MAGGQWTDHHGGSGTSGSRSCPPEQQNLGGEPWTCRWQTAGTWPGLPDQMIARPSRTTESEENKQKEENGYDKNLQGLKTNTKIIVAWEVNLSRLRGLLDWEKHVHLLRSWSFNLGWRHFNNDFLCVNSSLPGWSWTGICDIQCWPLGHRCQ